MWKTIEAAVGRVRLRVLSMVARGVVTLIKDELRGQRLQIKLLAGETRDGVERVQNYGFSSVPMEGAYPAIVLCPAGDRAQALAIVVDDWRHRPKERMPGDSIMYDWIGNLIVCHPGDPPEDEEDPPPNALLQIVAAKDLVIEVAGNAQINVGGSATLSTNGPLNLGGSGGNAVARVGDQVQIGPNVGVIISGSGKVNAS